MLESFLLSFLFSGGTAPSCRNACNGNGDDKLDISDGIYLLTHLFLGGPAPNPHSASCD